MTTDVRMRGFAQRPHPQVFWRVVAPYAQPLPAQPLGLTPLFWAGEGASALNGRVLAAPVSAPRDLPGFDRSAMDGYAVRAEDTFGASDYSPLPLTLLGHRSAGEGLEDQRLLGVGQALGVMTGAPLPVGADAVLMAEYGREEGGANDMPGVVWVSQAVTPGLNVSAQGEDCRAGDMVLPAGHRLRPQDGALLSALGVGQVRVVPCPRVAVLLTGKELVAPGQVPAPGQVADANGPLLQALATRDGARVVAVVHLADRPESIAEALLSASADVVLVSGGTSVGREDHLPTLVARLGTLLAHGVALRPGQPTGFGLVGGRPVFLLPGNPVACLVGYDFFAGPLLRRMGGQSLRWPYALGHFPLVERITSAPGRADYVRVALETGPGGGWRAKPIAQGGAGRLTTLTAAQGFVVVPVGYEGYPAGETVPVWLYDADAPAHQGVGGVAPDGATPDGFVPAWWPGL